MSGFEVPAVLYFRYVLNVLLISFLPLIRENVQCTFEPACVTKNKRNQVTSKTRIGTKIIMTSNGALSGVEVTEKSMRRLYCLITFLVIAVDCFYKMIKSILSFCFQLQNIIVQFIIF